MAGKLGEILIQAGLIDEHQLEIALNEQSRTGARLGDALRDLGFVTADAVSKAHSHSCIGRRVPSSERGRERTRIAARRRPRSYRRRIG